MINAIDNFLDRITMYRLVLYFLIILLVVAVIFSALKILPFSPLGLVYSTVVLVAASWLTNMAASKLLHVPPNLESVYITALILALLITPPATSAFLSSLTFLIGAAVLSQISKYVLNIYNKHIFNPAALAVVITSYAIGQSASWWVGTICMLPFVTIGGLLVLRKVQRFQVALAFLCTVFVELCVIQFGTGQGFSVFKLLIIDSPLIFFATIMLTEPLTMPPMQDGRIAYGILIGWLFAPQTHFGSFYFTPELALVVGNVFSYAVSPKLRMVMKLKAKRKAASGVYDFVFEHDKQFSFRPGQYMEWTLGLKKSDSRGNRRYLTLASSPTESNSLLGLKFYERQSAFKQYLSAMQPGDTIVGGQLAGDFVLPRDKNKKLAFVAGGIGITPFRSMLKYLVDTNEQRDIVHLYSNRSADEIAYRDVFEAAQQKLGIRTLYTVTGKQVPPGWQGFTGHFDAAHIQKEVPDFMERTFYISGSHALVAGMTDTLLSLGVHHRRIRTDFFPGLA